MKNRTREKLRRALDELATAARDYRRNVRPERPPSANVRLAEATLASALQEAKVMLAQAGELDKDALRRNFNLKQADAYAQRAAVDGGKVGS